MDDWFYRAIALRMRRINAKKKSWFWRAMFGVAVVVCCFWNPILLNVYSNEREDFTDFCVQAFNGTSSDCDKMFLFMFRLTTTPSHVDLLGWFYNLFKFVCLVTVAQFICNYYKAGHLTSWDIFTAAAMSVALNDALEWEELTRGAKEQKQASAVAQPVVHSSMPL